MKEYPSILLNLLMRLMLAGVILVAPLFLLRGLGMVLYPFIMVFAAILVAPAIARLFGLSAGALFYPNQHFDKPQPVYGIPEARRKEGRFEEALEGFQKITSQHPQELRAWMLMIEVAAVDLGSSARADAFYRCGLDALTEPEDRDRLTAAYERTLSRGGDHTERTRVGLGSQGA